jgi:DNA-binding transcriptional ArsR family regulator
VQRPTSYAKCVGIRILRKNSILEALFPGVRQRLLRATLTRPDKWWFLSELADALGTAPSSLQRELPALVNAGILEQHRSGTRSYFRAQRVSPIYPELRRIFDKTAGVVSKIVNHRDVAISTLHSNSDGSENRKRKHPGCNAKKTGTPLKRGAAVQIVCYPRPRTKAVLERAARKAGQSLSAFMIRASLERAAAIEGCKISDLIPESELRQYIRGKHKARKVDPTHLPVGTDGYQRSCGLGVVGD